MSATTKKRVTVKRSHPNPLFEKWLKEWKEKAREKKSKMEHCFSLALISLKKYPLPLESGKDCKILKGFGDKLCKMLDEKLAQHRKENLSTKPITANVSPRNNVKKDSKHSKSKTLGNYCPIKGSGPYAILLTLYEESLKSDYVGSLTKNEIIKKGQRLCDYPFIDSTKSQTAWSSMSTLIQKNLVIREENSQRFSLTNDGIQVAEKLYIQQKVENFQKGDKHVNSNDKIIPFASSSGIVANTNKTKEPTYTNSTLETLILGPNSFDIILLVDIRELNGSRVVFDNDPIIQQLKFLNVRHEIRDLKVGDYTWICRDSFGNELILPYIVERKRMDDLGKSIKDDRFHEQKFRLKQSGIKNLIYLIESYGKNEHCGLPISTLYQAATNTLIHDGFCVKFTDNGEASCQYLAALTNFLRNLFKDKTLVSCQKEDLPNFELDDDLLYLMPFKDFNKSSAKTRHFKIKEMFVKQLLKIKGMSVDRALAIVEKYPTPKILKMEYSKINDIEGEKLLSNIQYGPLKKNIGRVLSKIVYQFIST